MYQARNIGRATGYNSKFVVKAQVITSNRKNGSFIDRPFKGGIHICDTPEEVREVADAMVGNTLVTINPAIENADIMPNTGE